MATISRYNTQFTTTTNAVNKENFEKLQKAQKHIERIIKANFWKKSNKK